MKVDRKQVLEEQIKDYEARIKGYKAQLYKVLKLATEIKYIFPSKATRCSICDNYYKKEIMYHSSIKMLAINDSLDKDTPFGKYNYYANICKNCCKNKKAVRNYLDKTVYNPTFEHEYEKFDKYYKRLLSAK